MSDIKYTVYFGKVNNKIVYVGTTIQKPSDRFRWHRNNGKNFYFEVYKQFSNSDDMLNCEFNLIKKLKPKYNKITKRKQNLNKKLSQEDLDKRIGDKKWCQTCLKRRVNKGYDECYYCSRGI